MDPANHAGQSYQLDDWLVEPALNLVKRGDEKHHLEPLAMDVLAYLLETPGTVVTNDELLECLWSDRSGDPSMIKKRIGQIRRALGDDARQPVYIETIRQRGYRVIAPVIAINAAAPAIPESPSLPPLAETRPQSAARLITIITALVICLGGLTYALIAETGPPEVRGYRALADDVVSFPPVPSPYPLVTDGSVIYFNDWKSGRLGMRRLARAGGASVPVASPFDDPETLINPQGLTPDGGELLILSFTPTAAEAGLWTWPIVGGAPKRLGSGGSATYSPDGRYLFFAKRRRELMLANVDMTDQRLLGSVRGAAYWPSFSPDAQHVRVSVNDGRKTSILQVATDGSDITPVLPDWADVDHCCGSWTEDGTYYVFQATVEHNTQLWALGQDSDEPVRITRTAMQFRRPTIANSELLAVGWTLRGEIAKHNPATGGFDPVPGFESVSAEWFEYSPDNQWVAYVSYPDAALWRARADGRQRVRLSDPGVRTSHPSWSPDGSMIAYLKWHPAEPKHIGLRTRDGEVLPVADFDGNVGPPTWSPDGSSFAAHVVSKEGVSTWQMNIATSNIQELTQLRGMWLPRWSPDGRYFAAYADGHVQLIDMLGADSRPLVKMPESSWHRWSVDSRHVYVVDPFWMAERRAVKRATIADGAVSTVAILGNVKNTWGVAGSWVGIAPDGQPTVLRDLSIHNIYSLDWP